MNKITFLKLATLTLLATSSTLSAYDSEFKDNPTCNALHDIFTTDAGVKGEEAYSKFIEIGCEDVKEEKPTCYKPKGQEHVKGCFMTPITLSMHIATDSKGNKIHINPPKNRG